MDTCRNLVVAVALGLLLLSPCTAAAKKYRAPRRTVSQVAYAIGTSNRALSKTTRRSWASFLVDVARQYNFDALSAWALIEHESRWRPSAVSADGLDIGLAQMRWIYLAPCKEDRSSSACERSKRRFFDPFAAMRQFGVSLHAWRKLCRRRTGKAELKHVLMGYGGFVWWRRPKRRPQRTLCGRLRVRTKTGRVRWVDRPTPKAVRDILLARRRMIRRLRRKRIR